MKERHIIECNMNWIQFSSMNLRLVVLWAHVCSFISHCVKRIELMKVNEQHTLFIQKPLSGPEAPGIEWCLAAYCRKRALWHWWGEHISPCCLQFHSLCPNKCLMNTLTGGHRRGIVSDKNSIKFLFLSASFLLFQGYVSWNWTFGPRAS